ncbi:MULTISPECIES: TIGR03086 family metal-binding protein [unclassified Streptomyces]|uniref:TIGR03086 family metal-binding protein n=1 Tax=unclassified Streptomyces TaxID=2593676 RepID=UPI002257DDA8|nr:MULTISPECIES: TIGR03086 family metal-binding protein [unclassified Streptomyces]MCX4879793.1 TIGR03086 family metal-binding protein [Streptomyces sp. NBC_00847]MCX5047143.1 TIGR03086 family metal-binding protein [Streptomyces sp. NBC_00474]
MNAGDLLERSLAYALGSVAGVAPGGLGRGTPCGQWDLRELLAHLDDSLDALHEGLTGGRIGVFPQEPEAVDLACAFRTRACAVLGAWAAGPGERVLVGELPLDMRVMAAVGSVEIAVHGWDVAQACGRQRPIPAPLAAELLPVARCVVADEDRGVRFAEPVAVAACAPPQVRLLAFLGRRDSFPG